MSGRENHSSFLYICTVEQNVSCVGDGALDVPQISMVIIKYNLLEWNVKDAVPYGTQVCMAGYEPAGYRRLFILKLLSFRILLYLHLCRSTLLLFLLIQLILTFQVAHLISHKRLHRQLLLLVQ